MVTQKPFKKVGTHHGKFHADEVMATAILKEIFDVEVVRTRNSDTLSTLDIVYDVGGGEFDHHDMEKVYRVSGTPYAACGLIWKKFGKDVVQAEETSMPPEEADRVFKYIDAALIEGIDAMDNGVKTSEVIIPTANISSIISGFNPPWNSEISDDLAFNEAVEFASTVLENMLDQKISVMKAKTNVIEAYEKRLEPEILVLDEFCPWGQNLQEIDEKKEVLFVVYPSRDGFAIQTVRQGGRTFNARKDLPKAWAGKRNEELGEIIGIDDAVFCHPGRFIAGARSFDSILKMADLALAEPADGFMRRFIENLKDFLKRRKI